MVITQLFQSKSIIGLLLVVSCSLPMVSYASKRTQTEAQIHTMDKEIERTRKLLEALKQERSSVQAKIESSDRKIEAFSTEIQKLEAQLEENNQTVKKLQSRQQTLMATQLQQKDRITQSIRQLYKDQDSSRIKMMLNQENDESAARNLVYLDYLQSAQLKMVQAYEQTLAELTQVEQASTAALEDIAKQKKSLLAKKDALSAQKIKHQALLKEVRQKYKRSDDELAAMRMQREALSEALKTIKRQEASTGLNVKPREKTTTAVDADSFVSRKGKLAMPVEGKIIRQFNETDKETGLKSQGIFIDVAAGQPVKSVHDGTVIFADWFSSYGLLVIVDHGDNYLTLYAHNESLLKGEDEKVLAGEPLALSGQSGGQQVAVSYFEIRDNGTPINPKAWLAPK